MLALSNPVWLQGYFSTLVGLFDRVGLKTNAGKRVGIFCRLFHAVETQSEVSYKQLMIGVGPSYRERHRVRVHW